MQLLKRYFQMVQRAKQQWKSDETARLLHDHPYNECIAFERTVFRVNGKLVRGAHRALNQTIFKGTPEPHRKRSLASSIRKKKKTACRGRGRSHGIHVHAQLSRIAQAACNAGSEQAFLRKVQGTYLDGCVRAILAWLCAHRWPIMLSEHPIWDEGMRVATAVDAIVWNMREKRCMLLELKTGYNTQRYCWSRPPESKRLCAPLQTLVDCPFQRHALQAVLAAAMLARNYGIPDFLQKRDAALVMLVNVKDGVRVRAIPPLFTQANQEVTRSFCAKFSAQP